MKVSCLIPFFNERERIGKVLEQIVRVASIDEIICIDDGSTDGTRDLVRKQYPKIKLITSPKNGGKTEAVRRGLQAAKNECILLIDADLRSFKFQEIERAVRNMKTRGVDMIILRRIRALWTMKLVRGDILVSGDRLLKKTDLENILKGKVKRYQLEFAINTYMLDRNKRVYWMPTSAQNTYKFLKNGLLKGWTEMIMVTIDILWYVGLRNYLRQILFFCRKELV